MIKQRRKLSKTRIVFMLLCAFFVIIVSARTGTASFFTEFFNWNGAAVGFSNDMQVSSSTVSEEKILHIGTPEKVKGVYLTSWAAGNKKFRDMLFGLIDSTDLNTVVIDVKDYTGRISFPVSDPVLQKEGAAEDRIPDIREFIDLLHEKGIYVIARISSFQDSYLIKVHPEWAVKSKSGQIWKDYKGVKWLDPAAKPVWDYLAQIGREAYGVGFDELNFDYIRYPSDGNMDDVLYSWGDGRPRQQVMKEFFSYLRSQFPEGSVPISADLFGMTTSALGDLGIGQNISDALPYFDYICPMVYPSHYPKNFMDFAKPAEHPYEVVKYAMDSAVLKAASASTSPLKLRPWIQAFDLGAIYTPAMVKEQVKATYDSGLTGWLMWNAASVYQAAWFQKKPLTAGDN